ncbi:MAG: hypothetical protein H7070_10545 [Saprospiraceae bacterium]|nr:hypothetical protein [Pyrinomonadaceae bacterium]
MDVYHKILTKIYELADGRETIEVDLKELLKREGFFPSIDSISGHLITEGWMTETPRRHFVKLTHWGIAESKKALSQTPDMGNAITKDTNRLIADSREFAIMLEEFAADNSADKFKSIEKSFSQIKTTFEKIKANL